MLSRAKYLLPALSLASILSFCGCRVGVNGSVTLGPANGYSLNVTPQPSTIPAGSTVTFYASTNAPTSQVSWFLQSFAYGNLGSPTAEAGSTTFTYTAPSTPPVYSDYSSTPGQVTLITTAGATTSLHTFTITASSITTGISAYSSTVPLGATTVIHAYAVGSVNNGITLQVNGATGGSATAGTIAPTGGVYGQYIYTAPSTMPMTGSNVTVSVVSQADPTKTSSVVLTLK